MAFIRKRRPWDSQPQEAAEVRRDTEIGASLVSLILPPQGPIDLLLPSRTITKNANCNTAPSDDGIAYSSSDANSGLFYPTGSFTTIVSAASPITFFARVYVAATGVRRVLASDWNSGGGSQSIAIQQSAANKWEVYSVAGTGSPLSAGTVTVGWHTVIVSQSANSSVFLWVDGEYLGTLGIAGARTLGANAAWLDSGAYTGSIGWSTNKASLLAIGNVAADDAMARAFHDAPWDQVFAPRQIWVPVSAAGSSSPVGLSTETDTALALSAVQIAALGRADETDAALALAAVQATATGRADETDTALALVPVQSLPVSLAVETDTALALSAGSANAVGTADETDTAFALAGVQIAATGIALETDTALALTGITGTAPGIASESDTAFALAAVQKLLVGVATETDTALAPTAAVDDLSLILKILRNRQELNAATGTFTLYDDDGTTVLYQSNAWADAAGTIPYSGGVLARIDALA